MKDISRLKSVSAMEDYCLKLLYSDGFNAILQMEPFLKGTGSPLLNSTEFDKVHIRKGFIEWDCGVDLDPVEVYEFLKGFE